MRFWPRRKAVETDDIADETAYATDYSTEQYAGPYIPGSAVFGFELPGSRVSLVVEGECGVTQLDAMIGLLGSYRSQLEASAKARDVAPAVKVEAPISKASNTVLPSERPRWASKGNGNYPKSPVRNLPG